MTDAQWQEVYAVAVQRLKGWKVSDPDQLADTLAWYWWMVVHEGALPGWQSLKWAKARMHSGRPFPGTGARRGFVDAHKKAFAVCKSQVAQRRFPDPARAAQLQEEVSLVRQQCKARAEAVAMAAVMLSQTHGEAAQASGYAEVTVRQAWYKLQYRCRYARTTSRPSCDR